MGNRSLLYWKKIRIAFSWLFLTIKIIPNLYAIVSWRPKLSPSLHSISIQFSFKFHSIEWELKGNQKREWVDPIFTSVRKRPRYLCKGNENAKENIRVLTYRSLQPVLKGTHSNVIKWLIPVLLKIVLTQLSMNVNLILQSFSLP